MDPTPVRESLRLVLLDDHALLRESLARLLAAEPDFELVAACTTQAEAMRHLKSAEADVILVDCRMAREFIPAARKARCTGKVLVLARDLNAGDSAQLLKCGASGIFLDSDSSARLVQAIRLVANGEAWVDQKVLRFLAERYPPGDSPWRCSLTGRQQEVLSCVLDGSSSRAIASHLGVTESAVKATLQQLFGKAGVRTRSQLVRVALEAPRVSPHSSPHSSPHPAPLPAEPGYQAKSA